jgi:hypothetical protein
MPGKGVDRIELSEVGDAELVEIPREMLHCLEQYKWIYPQQRPKSEKRHQSAIEKE